MAGDVQVKLGSGVQAAVTNLPTSDGEGGVLWEPTQAETDADVVAELDFANFVYDVQVWRGAAVETIERGTFSVTGDITLTVTPA